MTPGLYMRGAITAALAVATSSCPAAGSVLQLVLYPALDYNFYKALHSAVNAALHLVVGLPIITFHRYGALSSALSSLLSLALPRPLLSRVPALLPALSSASASPLGG